MQVLGKGHTIRGLEKCDFTPIYEHFMAKKEVEKARSKEVRHIGGSAGQIQVAMRK